MPTKHGAYTLSDKEALALYKDVTGDVPNPTKRSIEAAVNATSGSGQSRVIDKPGSKTYESR